MLVFDITRVFNRYFGDTLVALRQWSSVLLLCVSFLGTGCSVHKPGGQFVQHQVYTSQGSSTKPVIAGNPETAAHLKRQYKKWAGTPYQWGGNSLRGVDCSGLMVKVFAEAFAQSLPRTTAQQVKVGSKVSKRQLKVGDLVFFKTGWNRRHVGVFMGGDRFLHASVKKGVTYSRLNDAYWKSRYWQSRRIL